MNIIKLKHFSILLLLSITVLISCEKEVELNLPTHESKLVVEGWIEQGKTAKVLLSLSAPYFTHIDSSNLREYAVTTAKVSIYDKNSGEILTLKPNEFFFPPYYYFGTQLNGEEKNEYEIEIIYRGHTYHASTTIPKVVPLDSAWFIPKPGSDTLGQIGIQFKDNLNEENYYRVLTKRKGKDQKFIPVFTSVFSDLLFNGKEITISLSKGNSSILDIGNDRFYHVNDTVIVKFCSIDEEHFRYWKGIQTHVLNAANPFAATSNKIESNIENGFGIWGGYAAWYDTVTYSK